MACLRPVLGLAGPAQLSGIDMFTPELLAQTDARMLADLTLVAQFRHRPDCAGGGKGDAATITRRVPAPATGFPHTRLAARGSLVARCSMWVCVLAVRLAYFCGWVSSYRSAWHALAQARRAPLPYRRAGAGVHRFRAVLGHFPLQRPARLAGGGAGGGGVRGAVRAILWSAVSRCCAMVGIIQRDSAAPAGCVSRLMVRLWLGDEYRSLPRRARGPGC